MKNTLGNKINKIKLNQAKIIKKPLKILKKINLDKFQKIKSFSLNETFNNFKKKIKKAEIDRIKLLNRERIKKAKQEKLNLKKEKVAEAKQIKKEQLLKLK